MRRYAAELVFFGVLAVCSLGVSGVKGQAMDSRPLDEASRVDEIAKENVHEWCFSRSKSNPARMDRAACERQLMRTYSEESRKCMGPQHKLNQDQLEVEQQAMLLCKRRALKALDVGPEAR